MAVNVPDTNTFSLSDVIAAVEDHAGSISDTLNTAHSNALSTYYDSSYSGSKNSLYNFRNYGPPDTTTTTTTTTTTSCVSYSLSNMFYSANNCTDACFGTPISLYGNTNNFSTCTKLYSNTSCATATVGYYSNGLICRYWSGLTLGFEQTCVI